MTSSPFSTHICVLPPTHTHSHTPSPQPPVHYHHHHPNAHTNALSRDCRTLHGNNLTGGLPDAWAAPGSFTALEQLTLSDNPHLGGTLPLSWGNQSEALPSLQVGPPACDV